MATIHQKIRNISLKKKKHTWSRALKNHPQLRGWVTRPWIMTPRKPNSARRSIAKIVLNNDVRITAYIPGVGHNLRRYSTILIRGGGCRDLPGVSYTCVRGVYDFAGLKAKTKRRSIYGAKWPESKEKASRRKNRIIKEHLSKNRKS